MEIEFGHVQKYNIERGFGFVSRTFWRTNKLDGRDVWFHITKIKRDYPDLAKKLDSDLSTKISFWYEIDNSDSQKVNKIWLDPQDIPKQNKDDLSAYLEQIWDNTKKSLPDWLDEVTLNLFGQDYKDELFQKRNKKILANKELEEKINGSKQSNKDVIRERLRQRSLSRISRRRQVRESLIEQLNSMDEQQLEQQNSFIESRRARRKALLKNIYIGLPEHLAPLVLWVGREYRTNRLSHIPGGSDVVVEYHDERVFGYDWIKSPPNYIRAIIAELVDYSPRAFKKLDEESQIEITKRKISRVFTRKYEDENERSTVPFTEIWNSETSDEMPWQSLERWGRQQNRFFQRTKNQDDDENLLDEFFDENLFD